MNNDDKVKKYLENEEVPAELEPENVKKMIDEQAPQKKRGNISATGRITALVACCAVIVGSTVAYMNHSKPSINKTLDIVENGQGTTSEKNEDKEPETESSTESEMKVKKTGNYMSGADDYEQIYTIYKNADSNAKKQASRYKDDIMSLDVLETNEESADVEYSASADSSLNTPKTTGGMGEGMGGGNQSVDENSEIVIVPESEEETKEQETSEPSTETASEQATKPDTEPSTEESTEQSTEPNTEQSTEPETEPSTEESTEPSTEPETEESEEYSDTYHQEQNVLEADIMKTDGKYIYYLNNSYSYYQLDSDYSTGTINIAGVDKGKFTSSQRLEVSLSDYNVIPQNYDSNISLQDMYLYNDMLVVIGTVYAYPQNNDAEFYYYDYKSLTFASVYTTGENPQLIDTYYQDGYYNDVRIAPDGCMYLITDYYAKNFEDITDEENIQQYIPESGLSEQFDCIDAECVLLPENCDDISSVSYTVIGSIDLNNSGSISHVDTKSLMNYTGNVYCSENNLYVTVGYEDTQITRFAIGQGIIEPSASGTVQGCVNDQFSMSEYDGYFRIATTVDEYEEVWHDYDEEWYEKFADRIMGNDTGYYSYENRRRDNSLYVLDMDLNIVGSIGGFGTDESIKSVNFSGDMAYVVTYEQTDPLFAIDLSDPASPTILDEFKILGFSTYMQKWTDGKLLGFGIDADENGIQTGIKLTMFDNSDPNNLKALDTFSINRSNADDYSEWISSDAVWDRKALLIAPEKNIIGIPVSKESWSDDYNSWNFENEYMFFSFDGDKFNIRGEIFGDSYDDYYRSGFNRALYIGDYIYVLSADKFVSADIATLSECDSITF